MDMPIHHPTTPCQPGPSRRPTDAATPSGSTTPSMSNEVEYVMVTTADPDANNLPAASQTPVPTPRLAPEDVRSQVAMIAGEVRDQATVATERAEREQENFRQHLRNESRLVAVMGEIKEFMEGYQETLDRIVADNSAYHSQMIDTMQVLTGRILGTSPDLLFPSRRVRHAQRDKGSGGDD